MFGDAVAMSWSDFFASGGGGNAPVPQTTGVDKETKPVSDTSNATDVIRTTTTAADARNVQELQTRIRAGGGVLTANPNSSDYIVAINNRLKFSVTRNQAGQYEIRESQNYYYLIGAAVLVGVLLLSKK